MHHTVTAKQACEMCAEVNRLFDTCWRDSVLRIYSIFGIRPEHSALIS